KKNVWADSHIASGKLVTLKATRCSQRLDLSRRSDMTSASHTTTTVPASGPNSNAAAIVNVSEIEKVIGALRIRNVDHAVTAVRATSTSQADPTGCRTSSAI